MIQFVPATREAVKARIALVGPSGSGKTYTALSLASSMGTKVAVIDTERGRSRLYAGINDWQFSILEPRSFSPDSLTEALAVAGAAGFDVVIIDSLSHYWMGVDGMLEQVDAHTKRGGSAFSSGWKEMRPVERRMIDALISYPGHVIITLRTKTEYVVEKDDRTGKSKPVKIGLKPEQREGIDYEFDVIGDLDLANTLSVSKTRIPTLHGASITQPGPELASKILEWLDAGTRVDGPLEWRAKVLAASTVDELKNLWGQANTAGMIGAPVLDTDDRPTVLGDLIYLLANRIKAADQHTQAAQQPEQPAADPQASAAQDTPQEPEQPTEAAAESSPEESGQQTQQRQRGHRSGSAVDRVRALLGTVPVSDADRGRLVCKLVGRDVAGLNDLRTNEAVRLIRELDNLTGDGMEAAVAQILSTDEQKAVA